jgi:hypothetical protein
MSENTTKQEDPEPTPIDRDCALFVRDALFPLRRDWGSSGSSISGNHHQIHPALMALDRLRTNLVDLRPKSTSHSNIFPRGVVLVKKSEALVGNTISTMEYNGQPEVDESTASVEVIPNMLTVKCMSCNGIPFLRGSSPAASKAAFVREKPKPWKNPDDDDYESSIEHELVVCSDRILQKDYYKRFGNHSKLYQHHREDLPVRSMMAVEEALAREITKLQVKGDSNDDDSLVKKNGKPISYRSFPSSSSSSKNNDAAAVASCEAYAGLELLAARAAECLLVRKTDEATGRTTETRMGSALVPPKFLFSVLPHSLQRNFVDRCAFQVATKHTVAEAEANENNNLRPRECVKTAWANRHQN